MGKKITFIACALLFAVAAQAQWNFSADKDYLLKHVTSGKYLVLHDSYEETNVVNAQRWKAKARCSPSRRVAAAMCSRKKALTRR